MGSQSRWGRKESDRTEWLHFATGYIFVWASLIPQLVKNPPVMQETLVWSSGQEDPLEKGKGIHSGIFVWRILWRGDRRAVEHGVAKIQRQRESRQEREREGVLYLSLCLHEMWTNRPLESLQTLRRHVGCEDCPDLLPYIKINYFTVKHSEKVFSGHWCCSAKLF